MNIDDYFEVYTGGNNYIKTWTPKALKEFAEDYHKQKLREGKLHYTACYQLADFNAKSLIEKQKK